jgi:hypothetical protein
MNEIAARCFSGACGFSLGVIGVFSSSAEPYAFWMCLVVAVLFPISLRD